MKEKRNWKRNGKTITTITVITFIVAVIFAITKADAAYAGNYNDIGTYNNSDGGKSINGVKISKNSEILGYALDMWEKNDEWKYTGSNIDGKIDDIESSDSNLVFIKGKSEPRFGININNIKNILPKNGSIVVEKYRNGRAIYKSAEYTYQTENENKLEESISLLKQAAKDTSKLELPSTDYSFDGVSYIYNIYDAAVIGQSGSIYTALDDCSIVSEGYAYYSAQDEYIIKKLPVVEHNEMDGYTCEFDGWYTHEHKVHVGDAIDLKTTIYPHWNISRISYNVNYIDVLGDQLSGKVIGTSTSTIYCNDEASGSDMGSDESAGAYYKGLYYTGCTSVVVREDCDVYRYFRPALYNIVFNGNMNTSGETEPLNNCVYGETYKLTENGYKRNGTITLDVNAEDATCATKSINVPYEFKGWSGTTDGSMAYTDCESVSDLCEADGEKQLYAIWDDGSVEISAIPEREGYRFDGWSKDKSATSGNTWFDVSDENECTLYAIWIKKQEETDNSGSSTDNSSTNDSATDNSDKDSANNSNAGSNNGNNTSGSGSGSVGDSSSAGSSGSGNSDSSSSGNSSSGSGSSSGSDSSSSGSSGGNSGSGSISGSSGGNSGSGGSSSSGGGSGSSGGGSTTAGNNSSVSTGTSGNTTSGSGISSENTTQNTSNENKKPSAGNNSNTSNSSNNNSSTNVDDDNTISDSDIVTQNPNINTNNKKGNNKEETSKDNSIYLKAGKKYTQSGIVYEIIKSNSKKRTVKVIKATKNITKAKIPGKIKIKGYKYKVVSIAKKAFIKCRQLKKAVIGKNIKSIGKKAFYKNKTLGKIKIKSLKLKKIGKSAFKHIKSKCVVKIAGSKKYSQKVFAMMNA